MAGQEEIGPPTAAFTVQFRNETPLPKGDEWPAIALIAKAPEHPPTRCVVRALARSEGGFRARHYAEACSKPGVRIRK